MRRIWLGGGGSGEDGGHAVDLAWRRGATRDRGRRAAACYQGTGRGPREVIWEQGARCRGVGMSGADDVAGCEWQAEPCTA
jgi:hypothetical protein